MKKYAFITEISQTEAPIQYIPYSQNTYYGNTANTYSEIGAYLYPEDYNTFTDDFEIRIIGVLIKDDGETTVLRLASSISECVQNKETFYYDVTSRDFYIHFPSHKPPDYYDKEDILFELALGFFTGNYDGQLIIDGSPYDKRLQSIPQTTRKLDDELKGVQTFNSFSITLDNTDGRFDGWVNDPRELIRPEVSNQKKLRGNLVRYLAQASENESDITDYSKYKLLQQGTIDSLTDGTILTITCIDIRKSINEPVANNAVATGAYTDLKDGTIKPWILGSKYGLTCKCLNKNANKEKDYTTDWPSNYDDYQYLLCDTDGHEIATDSIKEIYIDSIESDTTLPTIQFDTTNDLAYFVLPVELFATEERNEDGDLSGVKIALQDKVSVDVEGYIDPDGTFTGTQGSLINRGMNQIRYVLNKIKGDKYSDLIYDTTTWSIYEDDTDYNFKTGMAFYKPTEGYKVIEQIANQSLFGKFQINEERKYTWDSDDFEGQGIVSEFEKTKLVPGWFVGSKVKKRYDNIIPFFWTQYQNRDDDVEQIQYYDDTFKDDAFDRYGITGGEDKIIFETYLSELSDVLKYNERVHEITDIPDIQVAVSLADWATGTATEGQDLQAGDFIRVELNDTGDDNELGYGWAILKILSVSPLTGGLSPSENDWTVNITGRIIKWDTEYLITTDDESEYITEDTDSAIIKTAIKSEVI